MYLITTISKVLIGKLFVKSPENQKMFSNQSEKMKKTVSNSSVLFLIVITTTFFGYVSGRSGLHSEQSAPPARIQQCREGCLEKVKFFNRI